MHEPLCGSEYPLNYLFLLAFTLVVAVVIGNICVFCEPIPPACPTPSPAQATASRATHPHAPLTLVCTVLHAGHESLVLQGFIYNAFLFGCLTAWTMQSRVRFHFLAMPLATALLLPTGAAAPLDDLLAAMRVEIGMHEPADATAAGAGAAEAGAGSAKSIDASTLRKVLGNFGEVLPQVRPPVAFRSMTTTFVSNL